MDYIKTKNGKIYKKKNLKMSEVKGAYCHEYTLDLVYKDDIVKESGRLEDLCDVFVFENNEDGLLVFGALEELNKLVPLILSNIDKMSLKGLVKTKKGYEYAVVLNSSGNFELI